MTQSDEKFVGLERDSALNDLRASLQAQLQEPGFDPVNQEESLVHNLTLHPDREQYLEVFAKLFPFISLGKNVFIDDPYSPTPGDPERSMLDDSMYTDEALLYMFDKVAILKGKLEKGAIFGHFESLSDEEWDTIRREIALQHDHEIEKNAAATNRLRSKFVRDPSSISPEEADLIEDVRGVNATSSERLELLSLHPEIDALEDMKFTCIMDYLAYYDSMSEYRARLWALNDEERFTVILVPSDEQTARPRDTTDAPDEVRADKTVIAQLFDSKTGRVFEAVEKTNWYSFDASRQFKGVIPHVVEGMNEQPIYTQVYLRVKRDRSQEGSFEEQQRQYDASRLLIIKDKKEQYIENL